MVIVLGSHRCGLDLARIPGIPDLASYLRVKIVVGCPPCSEGFSLGPSKTTDIPNSISTRK